MIRVKDALATLRGTTPIMREKASSIAVVAACVLMTTPAWARPAHKPVLAHKMVAVATRHKAEPSMRHARVSASAHVSRREARVEAAPARRKSRVVERKAEPGLKQAPEPAADVATTPVEPEIHVHHDRKVHLSAEGESQETSNAVPPATSATVRRVATVEDFMAPLPPADAAPAAAETHPVKVTVTSTKEPALSVRKAKTIVVRTTEEKLAPPPPLPQIPIVQPVLFTRNGHLIVPPAMKGSHEILVHQNTMADQEGLDRIMNDEDLEEMRGQKLLVAVPVGPGLTVDDRLPMNRRYCRLWTATFLQALSRAHYARFHSELQVNSAVRTVEFQERLRYTNGNAAPAEGATASPHLTGQAVDIAKHGLSMTEIAWMRAYLTPLVQEGKVDVEEEFQQSCFHISVYKRYMPETAPKRVIPTRHTAATALAAAIR